MKATRFLWLLFLVSSTGLMRTPAQEATAPAPAKAGDASVNPAVVATLELAQTEPQFQVRLTIENRGQQRVHLLRLRPGWLEYNAGSLHDWQIQIDGPGGAYQFPLYTGLIPPLQEKDFIELAPGEAFSTTIHTEMATSPNGPNDAYKVGERDGTYNIIISRGTLRSNALKFTVGEPQ